MKILESQLEVLEQINYWLGRPATSAENEVALGEIQEIVRQMLSAARGQADD